MSNAMTYIFLLQLSLCMDGDLTFPSKQGQTKQDEQRQITQKYHRL